MSYGFLDIAITPSIRAVQQQMGADEIWTDFRGHREFDRFSAAEAAFIEQRDSFYIASVSETGWPYVQHRGGPRGFLKLIDEKTLAFADYRGNRQYISTGNLAADNRACLILMDYPNRARMKIYARVDIVALDEDPALAARLAIEGYKAKPERVFLLHLEAFDWNCAQHIKPRFTEHEIDQALQPMRRRLEALESENAALTARLRQHEEDADPSRT
ncbi:pyridoxamine 5'-phosphate oxidase family protein [Mesorhizobium sp. DCY119]|uniref:pyridoxamine 5'-phosphate oxidase family protein n=1 Tax=Mesorhizobium sp. DCY119 TaxID=2108445 RepID=UPI000E711ECD|nr:pyridoxamine 5'-phosphate oxidase family protein [Mesorhizobium sp. DCY119]RJG40405.1 pyridoxamine 5-phosphate oxidase [Mesorhizobium sp. DCY119]